jgi:hypothetical protein
MYDASFAPGKRVNPHHGAVTRWRVLPSHLSGKVFDRGEPVFAQPVDCRPASLSAFYLELTTSYFVIDCVNII